MSPFATERQDASCRSVTQARASLARRPWGTAKNVPVFFFFSFFSAPVQTAQIKARRLLWAADWLEMNLAVSVKNYTPGCPFLQRLPLGNTLGGVNVVGNVNVKGQIWKEKKNSEQVAALNAQKTTFSLDFRPVVVLTCIIWGKSLKQSNTFARICGFYSKALPTTLMQKWRGESVISERDIKLTEVTEGIIAQRLQLAAGAVESLH